MKFFTPAKEKILIALSFLVLSFSVSAQKENSPEQYGKTLNLGVGIGYYGYGGNLLPVISANYEFDVAPSFTLAPFVSFYNSSNSYYWGDNKRGYPYKYYYYHETVIPLGVKGTYYFDKLLNANAKWDFYLAGSLGFAIVNSSWDSDYYGDPNYFHNVSHLYLDVHAGAEYHLNRRLGLFLDLSTGVSTFGLAIH